MNWAIRQGDALEQLRGLEDGCVQCCVTSPPYFGLRDYGVHGQVGLEATPDDYVARLVAIFVEVKRVLKGDGTLWLNLGDSYCNTDKWGGGGNRGKHTVAPDGSVPSWRVRERRAAMSGLKPKDLIGIPWRVALALQAEGWYLRADIIWAKPNPMPESVRDRPTKAHEYLFLLAKSERYFYDADAIRDPLATKTFTTFGSVRKSRGGGTGLIKSENLSRDVPIRRPRLKTDSHQTADPARDRRIVGFNDRWDAAEAAGQIAGANKRSVWIVATHPFPEAHFATFPPALVEPCVLAGSRPGDLVLDPFSGAGTVGLVATRHGRGFLGIELNPQYVDMARRRIVADAPLFNREAEERA